MDLVEIFNRPDMPVARLNLFRYLGVR